MAVTVVRVSVILSVLVALAWGHGRMLNPPSRSSLWRAGFKTPRNYNDNELNCGGFVMQFHKNNGQCGVCGDPYQGPRENEAGGKYALGVIGEVYKPGQTINVTLEISTNHGGYFEFRLCPQNNPYVPITERCLDQFLLDIVGFGKRYHIRSRDSNLWVYLDLALPRSLTCKQCVLQWKWVAVSPTYLNTTGTTTMTCRISSPGTRCNFCFSFYNKSLAQNRGSDGKGGECFGCGPQEHFINCADIAIGNDWISAVPSHAGIVTPTPTPIYHARGKGQGQGQVQIHLPIDQKYKPPITNHDRFGQTKAKLEPYIQSSNFATKDWAAREQQHEPNFGIPKNIPAPQPHFPQLQTNRMKYFDQEAEAEQQEYLSGLSYSDMMLLGNVLNPVSVASAEVTCSHHTSYQVCEALPSLAEVGTFSDFCSSMCPVGTCPKSICKCTCVHESWGESPKRCRYKDSWKKSNPSMDKWCEQNCATEQCPSHLCVCG